MIGVRRISVMASAVSALACASSRTALPVVASPVSASTPAAAPTAGSPPVQFRAVRGATVPTMSITPVAEVKLLVPAIDSKSTCHVIEGSPIPGVARLLSLRFDSTAAGARTASLGLAADGTPVSYSEGRGDIVRRADDMARPRTKSTSISINFATKRGFVTNVEGGVSTPTMIQGDDMLSAAQLGNPNAMIARIRRECDGITARPATMAPGSAAVPVGASRSGVAANPVRTLPRDANAFAPAFPAVETDAICLDVSLPPIGSATRQLVRRFRANGVPVREVMLSLDAAGRPVSYQDTRSANLQAPGGPTATPRTTILIDFARRTAELSNVAADGRIDVARSTMEQALDAKSLGIPLAAMDALRAACERK